MSFQVFTRGQVNESLQQLDTVTLAYNNIRIALLKTCDFIKEHHKRRNFKCFLQETETSCQMDRLARQVDQWIEKDGTPLT